jgi:SAM-dependent methyltransferase
MPGFYDPEDLEKQALHNLVNFAGGRFLEVGSGDGRMMRHYIGEAQLVCGLDFDGDELAIALENIQPPATTRLHLVHARAEALPFSGGVFDVVVMGWSLCCVTAEGQQRALSEAVRVASSAVLDIRAGVTPPAIFLRTQAGDDILCGPLKRTVGDTHSNEGASRVVAEAVKAGRLVVSAAQEFDWVDVYDTADEMVSEIAEEWQSWVIDEDTVLRLMRLLEMHGRGARPFVRQGIRAQLLRKPA